MFLLTTSSTIDNEKPVSIDIFTHPLPDEYMDMIVWFSHSFAVLDPDMFDFSRDQERVLQEGHLAGTFSVRENHL
jgi:hypothetical protein